MAFDEFLARNHPAQPPFEIADYRAYVDGRSRSDGVRSFLAARSISLPDEPDPDVANPLSVRVLAERKDQLFHDLLRSEGVRTFAPAVELLHSLHSVGVGVAVVSASRNAAQVLSRGGPSRRGGRPGRRNRCRTSAVAREARSRTVPGSREEVGDGPQPNCRDRGRRVRCNCRPQRWLRPGYRDRSTGKGLGPCGQRCAVVVSALDELDWSIGGTVRAGSSPDSSCELCAQTTSTAWWLEHVGFEPAVQGARESLFALGNGYLATRGAFPRR